LPALARSYPRRFAFYVADPRSSIHHLEQIKNFAHLLGFWQSFDVDEKNVGDRQSEFRFLFVRHRGMNLGGSGEALYINFLRKSE
jgi:hypothetical protein